MEISQTQLAELNRKLDTGMYFSVIAGHETESTYYHLYIGGGYALNENGQVVGIDSFFTEDNVYKKCNAVYRATATSFRLFASGNRKQLKDSLILVAEVPMETPEQRKIREIRESIEKQTEELKKLEQKLK